jgi:DNA-binding NarL/FixJ family response regulator
MQTKILIYEDNEELRASLVSLLSRKKEFIVAGDFHDCYDVEEHVLKYQPHVILMDIDLPEINGIEGVKKIRAVDARVLILMITVFDDTNFVYQALYAGANGYLLKKHISERLTAAILDVLEGGAPMSPAIARLIIDAIQQKGVPKEISEYNLTPREVQVLISLAKGNSYKMVAAELNISIETVRSHIKNIYGKLHVQSQGEAISKALREGLID